MRFRKPFEAIRITYVGKINGYIPGSHLFAFLKNGLSLTSDILFQTLKKNDNCASLYVLHGIPEALFFLPTKIDISISLRAKK